MASTLQKFNVQLTEHSKEIEQKSFIQAYKDCRVEGLHWRQWSVLQKVIDIPGI